MNHATSPCDVRRRLVMAHLKLRMTTVRRALRQATLQRKKITAELRRPDVTSICVSDEQVDQLFDQISMQTEQWVTQYTSTIMLTEKEREHEQQMRRNAAKLDCRLPLLALSEDLAISAAELNCLLMCIAPELHVAYRRIYAFIQDDFRQQLPGVGLLCDLTTADSVEWFCRRADLSAEGRLRRLGLVEAVNANSVGLQQEFRVAPMLLPLLAKTETTWCDRFYDGDEVVLDNRITPSRFVESAELNQIADAIVSGKINTVGVWGSPGAPIQDAVMAIAVSADRPLRTWRPGQDLQLAIRICSQNGYLLWITSDDVQEGGADASEAAVVSQLQRSTIPVILSGGYSWRPTDVLRHRRYSEVVIGEATEALGQEFWQELVPSLDSNSASDLAQRYRLTLSEQIAAARAAAVHSEIVARPGANNDAATFADASRMVSQKKASRFATPLIPRRTADDLILPASVHAQVLEVPRFFRALGTINESWGVGATNGGGGIKALFTGDSGTGKTLAAEVIAKEIGLPLMRLDVSQLVSKWLGETEKNIDSAFREAETSHSMLFFDEADTLFGKRGEIQSGTDRYANLEVGFLLQRLEQFSGLAILASNLKDEIDAAFTRRFQVLLHFPRPGADERLKLWRKAFPAGAPLDPNVDLTSLVDLDLTGAGIMSAAQTAALLAVDQGDDRIRAEHVAAGISRQFHRESRVLGPDELKTFSVTPGATSVIEFGEARGA